MKVIFDYQIFFFQNHGGISRYFYELANELSKIKNCEPKIIAPYHKNEYLNQHKGKPFIFTLNAVWRKLFYNRILNARTFMNEIFAQKKASLPDTVFHETYYANCFKVKAPRVITIHDMIYELFNNQLEDEKIIIQTKKRAILDADHVIVVSEHTKSDLLKFYPEVSGKISVVYHGISPVDVNVVKAYTNKRPYILFVGNRDGYKNFATLLEIYASELTLNTAFDLIAFGGGSFTENESEAIVSLGVRGKVQQLSGDDNILNTLYKGASVLAYLSLYEGFGFPVLEAMLFGCPVICSNGSSLPEVAGDCAQKIDVSNKDETLNALLKVLFEKNDFNPMVEQGKKRALAFTWKKCAEETFKVYQSLLN